MASRASIGGHPIHPMLVPFPIGLLGFSFIADLLYLWRGNPVWENYIAFYTLLGGIIGAAAAAIPGLIDWATLTDQAAVRVANWHARVNIIGLVIFIASFYLRTTSGMDRKRAHAACDSFNCWHDRLIDRRVAWRPTR